MDPTELRLQNAALGLLANTTVRQRAETKLIDIRVRSNNPDRAKRIADEFATQFMRRVNQERRQTFAYRQDYLTQQVNDVKEQLAAAERRLQEFSGQSDLRLLQEARETAITTMNSLNAEIENLRNDLAVLQADSVAADDERLRELLILRDPYYENFTKRLSELRISRARLSTESLEAYRPLELIDQEIRILEDQLKETAETFQRRKQDEVRISQLRLASLEERLREHELTVSNIETQMIEYRVMERDVESTRQIFNTLIDQTKRMDINNDIDPTFVTVEDWGTVASVPSEPRLSSTLSRFGLFGVLLGVALVFGLNYLDRTVRNPMVIEQTLRLPSLGFVPFLPVSKLR